MEFNIWMRWALWAALTWISFAENIPNCYVWLTIDKVTKKCAKIGETSVEGDWERVKINRTKVFEHRGHYYINATINIDEGQTLDEQVTVQEVNDCSPCWRVIPLLGDYKPQPFTLTLEFLPVSQVLNYITARRFIQPELHPYHFTKPVAGCSEVLTRECLEANITGYTFESRKNSIELALSIDTPLEFEYKLYSAGCNVACCSETVSDCNLSIIPDRSSNGTWNASEKLIVQGLKPSNYCVIFHLKENPSCCNMCSHTISLNERKAQEIEPYLAPPSYQLVISVYVIAVIFTFVAVILATLRNFKGRTRCCSTYNLTPSELQHPPKKRHEGPLWAPEKKFEENETVEVLLLYARESESFQILMDDFRLLLKKHFKKVWDPLEESAWEEVSEGPAAWVGRVLGRPGLRVVLVEAEASVQAWAASSPLAPTHHLDPLFLYTLSAIHDQPLLPHDYRRLFVIRFKELERTVRLKNLVTFARYEMPQHYISLIQDISGLKDLKRSNRHDFIEEREELETSIKKYIEQPL